MCQGARREAPGTCERQSKSFGFGYLRGGSAEVGEVVFTGLEGGSAVQILNRSTGPLPGFGLDARAALSDRPPQPPPPVRRWVLPFAQGIG